MTEEGSIVLTAISTTNDFNLCELRDMMHYNDPLSSEHLVGFYSGKVGLLYYLSEMFEDVVDDDFLGFVGMNSGEGIHVDDGVFKADERESKGAFQSLDQERKSERREGERETKKR